MWERVKLSKNYQEALAKIDEQLIYWPKFIIHKCKQRLTKITQYLIKMRKLALKSTPKLIGVKKKIERREAKRELKAEAAARLEQSIEKELLQRLKSGTYGEMYDDIVNMNTKAFDKVMDEVEEVELEDEFVEDLYSEEEADDDDEDLEGHYTLRPEDFEDFSDDSGIDHDDEDDAAADQKPPRKKKQRKSIEIEYENENDVVLSIN
ncbi:hypothetical protein MP638_007146 [Amoeboaphelidium occidentale]|nr:hypothetical protein MP638_007146 [Amoeboaphelidium occidentale]